MDTPGQPNSHQEPPPSLTRLLWLSCWVCVLFSGPVFGFGALQTVMERDGEYAHLCEGEDEVRAADRVETRGCAAQETAMSLIYTLGGTLPFWSGPTGFTLDLLGPTVSVGIAGALVTTGLLLFGVSSTGPDGVDLLAVGFLLMAAGGCLGTMCVFPVSFLFPKERQGQILGLLNCLFDASSAVFLPLQLLHGWSPRVFSRLHWFLVSAILAGALYASLVITWRGGHSASFAQIKLDSTRGSREPATSDKSRQPGLPRSPSRRLIYQRGVREQLCSAEFVCFAAFCAIHITKSTSFLGINKMILADLGDSNQTYLAIFTAMLPASVVFVPLITWCLDRFGLGSALHVVNCLGAGYAAASLVPSLPFQLVTFALYTNLASVYTARCFGPTNVGRLHGMAFTLATTFSFGNYLIVSATNSQLNGDFAVYSWCSLLATVPVAPMVCWLDYTYLTPLAATLAKGETTCADKSNSNVTKNEETQVQHRSAP